MAGRPPTLTVTRDNAGDMIVEFNRCKSVPLVLVQHHIKHQVKIGALIKDAVVTHDRRTITIRVQRPDNIRNDARTSDYKTWWLISETLVKTILTSIPVQKTPSQVVEIVQNRVGLAEVA